MLIQLDQESSNALQDNVLYYISGFVVRALTSKLKCKECIGELLLDPRDPHASKVADYPIHARFTCFKQKGGLILASPAVLKIVKAAEVLLKKRVQWQRWRITYETNIDLKIQYALLKLFCPGVFWVFCPFLSTCNWSWKQPLDFFAETCHTKVSKSQIQNIWEKAQWNCHS